MSSYVELVDVTKRFGDHIAVDRISFAVNPGSFFSLLGPSGCGKSTTLRMLSGFEHPDSGRIMIDGDEVSGVPPYRRPTNMVFQRWALFPHMTVYANVAFGLQVDKVARSDISARVLKMLDLVGLADFIDRKPGQLSGGQMQRVALARALVKQPKVLLLDEPLGALDLKLRNQMQLELKRIQREIGTTFIYVTHDQGEAMTMSDAIAVMNKGRIEQLDTPQAIYDRPCTRFVADFIGSTNLIPVTIMKGGAGAADRQTVQAGEVAFDVAHGGRAEWRPDRRRLHPARASRRRTGSRLRGGQGHGHREGYRVPRLVRPLRPELRQGASGIQRGGPAHRRDNDAPEGRIRRGRLARRRGAALPGPGLSAWPWAPSQCLARQRRRWIPLLLLSPAFALMIYVFVAPMLAFLRFSVYSLPRRTAEGGLHASSPTTAS